MNLATLLTALEGLVVEMALWVILVPKTLIHVIRNPRAIASLVSDEGVSEQHDEYVSLVLLWLIVGVLPGIPIIVAPGGPQWIAHQLLGKLDTEPTVAAGAMLLLLGPLAFAASQVLVTHRRFARNTLRRPFVIQCGCFAPFLLAYFAGVFAFGQAQLTIHTGVFNSAACVFLLLGAGWFLAAETIVLHVECRTWGRSAAALAFSILFWIGLVTASRLLLVLMGVFYS